MGAMWTDEDSGSSSGEGEWKQHKDEKLKIHRKTQKKMKKPIAGNAKAQRRRTPTEGYK